MSAIVRIEVTHCLRTPNVNVDETAKRYNGFLSISPVSNLASRPNDLFLVNSLSGGVVVPSEDPYVGTAFPLHFEKTSLLISAHAFSLPYSIY
jgi:hypothetical protein